MTNRSNPDLAHPRRRFIGRLAAAIAALTAGLPNVSGAESVGAGSIDSSDHDAWMKSLKGKHRQFFHEVNLHDRGMLMANNYLDVYQEAFGAKPGEASGVIGVHGAGLALAFNDAAWAKYRFGKSNNVIDPATKEPATKNIFRTGGPLTVEETQKRGVVFLMCNMALRRVSRSLAAERGEPYETIYEDLKASSLPGVILVPAMVVAINRAQEAGFTYARV